jgi:hypothetical protein
VVERRREARERAGEPVAAPAPAVTT